MDKKNAPAWWHETCGECGIPWCQPSPECPHVIWDRHPRAPVTVTHASQLDVLKQAREYVQELYAVKNDKGYPRFSGNVQDVLSQELRVADWLYNS